MDSIRDFLIGIVAFIYSLFPLGNTQLQVPFSQAPTPTPVNAVQQSLREAFHFPTINSIKINATPYLTLPFRKADLQRPYEISEGWVYSADEIKIHQGNPIHLGVDFALPYGTPVVAPADGYAMSSYQSFRIKDSWNNIRTYQGKQLNVGFGYFVSIYNPEADRFVDLTHLSDVDPQIPFSPPFKTEDGWAPTNHNEDPEKFMKNPYVAFIKKGTVIGKVGYSGLTWGYEEYKEGAKRPVVLDNNTNKSWDEPHIHFAEFFRDPKTHEINYLRDPYDIYDVFTSYPTLNRKTTVGPNPLFFLNNEGLPKYADE
ncbi:MAG: hypothetical protein HYW86_03920 [Candidatus Roizmanbacteria bacterium]|nr:MAG: hypothetical protein HYW86_03920 [Candidatus Roizmanbacteria bacterium]